MDKVDMTVFGIEADKPTPNGNIYPREVLQKMVDDMPDSLPVYLAEDMPTPVPGRLAGAITSASFDGRRILMTGIVDKRLLDGAHVHVAFDARGKVHEKVIDGRTVRVVEEATLTGVVLVDKDGKELRIVVGEKDDERTDD